MEDIGAATPGASTNHLHMSFNKVLDLAPEKEIDEKDAPAKRSVMPPPSMESEKDLRHFLKVAKPSWTHIMRDGHKDIDSVIEKLKEIGVHDIQDLVNRVETNTINDDLVSCGHTRFSQDTLHSFRKRSLFIRSLQPTLKPHIRQVGPFAPVPQMMSSKSLCSGSKTSATSPKNPPSSGKAAGDGKTSSDSKSMAVPDTNKASSSSTSGAASPPLPGGPPQMLPALVSAQGSPSTGSRNYSHEQASDVGGFSASGVLVEGSIDGKSCKSSARTELPPSEPISTPLPGALRLRGAAPRSAHGRRRQPLYSSASAPDFDRASLCSGHRSFDDGGSMPSRGSSAKSRSSSPMKTFAAHASASPTASWQAQGSLEGSPRAPMIKKVTSGAINQDGHSDGTGSKNDWQSSLRRVSSSLSALNSLTGGGPSDELTVEEVARLQQMGATMRSGKKNPRWLDGPRGRTPTDDGEQMLREQDELDHRDRFVRQMQGGESSIRSHISRNIATRLREEADRDAVEALNTQQRCMNIRKNLTSMSNARRELSSLRVRVQSLFDDENVLEGLSHHFRKSLTSRSVGKDDEADPLA
eukprot:gnl/TRDRNA2_/TRDRNA2_133473_c0_seq1.p1 gnl/TRDRNA2_/TRDRNA2_133473_c0~~gnl/TRDRNA2_/TRDRNA2_133473_c0_seq1.p1  ORF type:complete len:627 (-),score=89.10 gnl/TRDRNA2_/TRDRNA2_133473_c0_seq1:23-1768(-)